MLTEGTCDMSTIGDPGLRLVTYGTPEIKALSYGHGPVVGVTLLAETAYAVPALGYALCAAQVSTLQERIRDNVTAITCLRGVIFLCIRVLGGGVLGVTLGLFCGICNHNTKEEYNSDTMTYSSLRYYISH